MKSKYFRPAFSPKQGEHELNSSPYNNPIHSQCARILGFLEHELINICRKMQYEAYQEIPSQLIIENFMEKLKKLRAFHSSSAIKRGDKNG